MSTILPQGFANYKNRQSFLEANQCLMENCTSPKCINLNDTQKHPIGFIFRTFLEAQANCQDKNYLSLNPNPKRLELRINSTDTDAYFNLHCYNHNNTEIQRFLSRCVGSTHNVTNAYFLQQRNSTWKEFKYLPEVSEITLSNQQNPELFGQFVKWCPAQNEQPTPDQLPGNPPESPASSGINPLNVTLATVATVGAVAISYGIYKLHSLAVKHWNKELQKEKQSKYILQGIKTL